MGEGGWAIYDHTQPFNGTSSESFFFFSPNQVRNDLMFVTHAVSLALLSLCSLPILFLIFRRAKTPEGWNFRRVLPSIFGVLGIISLLFIHLVHFLGVRGPMRLFPAIFALSFTISEVTILGLDWFKIIILTQLRGQEKLLRILSITTWAFPLFCIAALTPICLGAGSYDHTDPLKANLVLAAAHLLFGLVAFAEGLLIFLLGRKLGDLIALNLRKELKEEVLRKIKIYTLSQTFVASSVGSTMFAIGLWGVISFALGSGMHYFYYLGAYGETLAVLTPSLLVAYVSLFSKEDMGVKTPDSTKESEMQTAEKQTDAIDEFLGKITSVQREEE